MKLTLLQIANEVSIIFQVTDYPPAHTKVKAITQPFAYADPNVLRSVYKGKYHSRVKEDDR